MKRSEMIHLGANVLDHKLNIMDNYELVDAILEVFESAGMTPPFFNEGPWSSQDSIRDYKWEPEDA